jgi:hypothetical protein
MAITDIKKELKKSTRLSVNRPELEKQYSDLSDVLSYYQQLTIIASKSPGCKHLTLFEKIGTHFVRSLQIDDVLLNIDVMVVNNRGIMFVRPIVGSFEQFVVVIHREQVYEVLSTFPCFEYVNQVELADFFAFMDHLRYSVPVSNFKCLAIKRFGVKSSDDVCIAPEHFDKEVSSMLNDSIFENPVRKLSKNSW